MYSGGVASWAAAKRVVELFGAHDTVLLFTDTKQEDAETYRFLTESAANVGAHLEMIADGRDIWQVYKDVKLMGNSRVDPCSRILKRELADKWVATHFKPEDVTMYVGMDFTEMHRFERMRDRKVPYVYEAPLLWEPPLTKAEIFEWARAEGLELPVLYKAGMQHNNCAGFCIKAGQGHYQRLWEQLPDRYLEFERKEQEVYNHIGKQHPFLRVTDNGELKYLTLREFREQYLEGPKQCDLFDIGGCGCFSVEGDTDD